MATMTPVNPMRVFTSPKHHEGGIAPGRPDSAYRAYQILYLGYIVAPLVAGVDKFFHYLADWNQYLAPAFANWFGGASAFMNGVGVLEIFAGCLVAVNPRVGGLVVCGWLWCIIVNLLMIPGYFDIALRDFGLSLGALALSGLAADFNRSKLVRRTL